MVGRPDHEHVSDDGDRRARTDRPDEIDSLSGPVARHQVYDPAGSEALDRVSGLRVEHDHVVSAGDDDDPPVPGRILPVGDAPSGVAPGSEVESLTLVHLPHPQGLARSRVDRDNRAVHARCGVKHPVDHERRGLELRRGIRTEVSRLPEPRYLELAHVRCVDLVERCEARVRGVSPVDAPFTVRRSTLRVSGRRDEQGEEEERKRALHVRIDPVRRCVGPKT